MIVFLHSIVVSIPACHAGDLGSIPSGGAFFCLSICKGLLHSTPFFFSPLSSQPLLASCRHPAQKMRNGAPCSPIPLISHKPQLSPPLN